MLESHNRKSANTAFLIGLTHVSDCRASLRSGSAKAKPFWGRPACCAVSIVQFRSADRQ